MKRTSASILKFVLAISLVLPGCAWKDGKKCGSDCDAHYEAMATKMEYPDICKPECYQAPNALSPDVISKDQPVVYWDMRLEEAIQTALANSKVMQELGGLILRSPESLKTISNPSIVDTDPRFGVESALAEYDAQLSHTVTAQKNDRVYNNVFAGGGTNIFQQDLDVFRTQVSKRAMTGSEFTFRNNTTYDANNSPGNLFGSAWDVNYEAQIRQPLLQGAGVEFNRIAGPSRTPGVYNGVLVARANTDIALSDFEIGIRDLVSNVENAYWDVYLAYRDLDAKVRARDAALESWRSIQARYAAGRRGGEAEKEAEAREQYFRFQEDVQNAWSGRLVDGTQTNNGSSGGTLRGNGLRVAERRLRLILNLPISDGRLIRTADEPRMAKLLFDWDQILPEALARRPELRKQKWLIKRRELELIASKNFLLPQLDIVGLYRWRGFGKDLLNATRQQDRFNNAYQNLTSGDFQEWELDAEFNMPIGFRKGHAGVRNAQLVLSRERGILQDQEEQVVHDLSDSVGDVQRAYEVAQTDYNRRVAAKQQVAAVQAAYEVDKAQLYSVLDAQRRLADADSRFFAALVEYALAVKNVHFEKGSLLDYNQVFLSEGPWPDKAARDAERFQRPMRHGLDLNYLITKPPLVSQGEVPQNTLAPPPTQSPNIPPPPTPPAQPEELPSRPQGQPAAPLRENPTTNIWQTNPAAPAVSQMPTAPVGNVPVGNPPPTLPQLGNAAIGSATVAGFNGLPPVAAPRNAPVFIPPGPTYIPPAPSVPQPAPTAPLPYAPQNNAPAATVVPQMLPRSNTLTPTVRAATPPETNDFGLNQPRGMASPIGLGIAGGSNSVQQATATTPLPPNNVVKQPAPPGPFSGPQSPAIVRPTPLVEAPVAPQPTAGPYNQFRFAPQVAPTAPVFAPPPLGNVPPAATSAAPARPANPYQALTTNWSPAAAKPTASPAVALPDSKPAAPGDYFEPRPSPSGP